MASGDVLMYPVSRRFLDALTGSHEMVARARLCGLRQTGVNPLGLEVPILGGDVKISRTADVKRTLDLTIPGDYWDAVQPYGVEMFVERGIDFGDGTQEYVPLGYFRVQDVEQPRAPRGPLTLSGRDRNAQLQGHRRVLPITVPDGTSHRQVFEALINAAPIGGDVLAYRAFGANAGALLVPITWTGYDPDAVTLNGSQVWEQDAYEFLALLAESLECVLAFTDTGTLEIALRDAPTSTVPVWTVAAGPGGGLLRYGRSTTREGVYNVVSAYGSDPSSPTPYALAYNFDTTDPLYWAGGFGAVVRFYASPLIRTAGGAQSAADAVLARYTGLPQVTEVDIVPNPALRPNDLVTVAPDGAPAEVWQVDEVTVPLVNGPSSPVTMIPRNSVPDAGGVAG